jgi:hypothetical protein
VEKISGSPEKSAICFSHRFPRDAETDGWFVFAGLNEMMAGIEQLLVSTILFPASIDLYGRSVVRLHRLQSEPSKSEVECG